MPNESKKSSVANHVQLEKDIWVNIILPNMDINSLLALGATSKEARRYAMIELMKRPAFTKIIQDKIATCESHIASNSRRLWEQWVKAWLGGNTESQIFLAGNVTTAGLSLLMLRELMTVEASVLHDRGVSREFVLCWIAFGMSASISMYLLQNYTNQFDIREYNRLLALRNENYYPKIIHALTHLNDVTTNSNYTPFNLFAPPRASEPVETPDESSSCVIT